MHPLLIKKDEATQTKVAAGKTLEALAKEHDLPDWRAIALYNWGTDEPSEVNRVLFETLGWEKADDDPAKTVIQPHANADREILIPKRWKQGQTLEIDKTHTIKIKKPVQPPVAVAIDQLSRWFIPGQESCDLVYSLQGLATNAAKVELDVFGSNYCSAGDWNDGFVKFAGNADLKDTELYKNVETSAAPERGKAQAIAEWKGRVTATTGALGKKFPGAEDRVINVAFSPYTTVLRYYKDGGDKTARIELDAFWPEFDDAGVPKADSLKIRFAIRNTDRIASTQGSGSLLVFDGADELVYREPISLANLAKKDAGFCEVAWDGKYSPHTKTNSLGGDKPIAADMPYRVQVQVHTGPDQANGLALAAMSTEVRLYVHPQTHLPSLDPYDALTDKPSFAIQCNRDLLAVQDPIVRGDGELWLRHQLAKHGFHPGPVENPVAAAMTAALAEFKRSVPKRRAKNTDPYARFAMDASKGADVLDAVEDLAAAAPLHRPWFGDPGAANADFAFDDAAASTRLNDPTGEMTVWVDDRHYYTDASNWLDTTGAKGAVVRTKQTSDAAAMGNYGLIYTAGDAMTTAKADWIPRPWIPLSVPLALLSKGQTLSDTLASPSAEDGAKMAKAVGPIRVDWSFDEIDADPPVETQIDTARYDNQVSRPKLYAENARNANKAAGHARKDFKKSVTYSNAPADCGGVRPAAAAEYHKALYAQQAESLKPWRAESDPAFETMATIAHDCTGQADDRYFAKRQGKAGIYFRPPTVGGDGMRLRAQVRFKPVGDYQHPNLAVLDKRYPRLPQAWTAKLRVWRKASVRAYISWSPNSSWGAHSAGLFEHFKPAYLHFVYERGDAAVTHSIGDFFGNDKAFKTLVKESLDTSGAASAAEKLRAKDSNISRHPQRLWPWYGAQNYGLFEPSAPNVTKAVAVKGFYEKFTEYFCVLSNLYALEWVKSVEKRSGKLRGHTVVEFQAGDDFFVQQYECMTCAKKFFYVEKDNKGDSMLKAKCPAAPCVGRLKRAPTFSGMYTCGNGHAGGPWKESSGAGGGYAAAGCMTSGCGSVYAANQVTRVDYVCDKCNWTFKFADATGTAHVGETCYSGTCSGKLHRPGGDAGLFTETYTCSKCALDVQMNETALAGGSHAGASHSGCARFISGKLRRKAVPVVTAVAPGNHVIIEKGSPSGYTGIPVPSIGNPLGVSLNSKADTELWAHELAHNRYLAHAANAGGVVDADHDHVANTHFNFAGINETVAASQFWDRACLMTYVTHLRSYDPVRDRRHLCGKCVLKTRGWLLGAGAITGNEPASASHE